MFYGKDMEQIRSKGIELQTILKQLEYFRSGFPFVNLDRPAVPGDGILVFTPAEKDHLISYFKKNMGGQRIMKFVPASGAASRMFKNLFEFRASFDRSDPAWKKYLEDPSFNSVRNLVNNIDKFAFYEDLLKTGALRGRTVAGLVESGDLNTLISAILDEQGLNYGSLPKALLKFHRYPDGSRTAMEEHLVEAASYVKDNKNISRIHFTVSPEHIEKFLEKADEVRNRYESKFGIVLEIGYSVQKSSTDTMAVDENNEPFRNEDGSLLFRPAGHGALLGNLEETDAEIVFIKNIDNIVPDRLKPDTIDHKMLIGGYLLQVRERIRKYLLKAEKGDASPDDTKKISEYTVKELMLGLPQGFAGRSEPEKQQLLKVLLDRPVRVCGMVKNEGEPGGGPYWVRDREGGTSLQIVESSQVNMEDNEQNIIFCRATHFNPVDLVCSIRDYKGNKFRLDEFTDPGTGFISRKSSGGRTLKAQELPGLWNGSMAKWITIFVEVPVITFNPVKTINDLLRKEHQ